VVLADELDAGTRRGVDVHTERADPEVVLQRVPDRVARLIRTNGGDLVDPLRPEARHGRAVQPRAMSGTRRPSSSTRAFHVLCCEESSLSSWPRSASRTGCAESRLTRYWYQERSQAIVTTISALSPESGIMLARGAPRLLAIPPTVRRKALALKRSAASTTASSGGERRRRTGSDATPGSGAGFRGSPKSAERLRRRRWRAIGTTGVVGLPSLIQPC